jgi:hypothetical protein
MWGRIQRPIGLDDRRKLPVTPPRLARAQSGTLVGVGVSLGLVCEEEPFFGHGRHELAVGTQRHALSNLCTLRRLAPIFGREFGMLILGGTIAAPQSSTGPNT